MAANALYRAVTSQISGRIGRSASAVETYRREGRFQRWLSLVVGVSGAISGVEVGYMHYRGSYSRRIMYTPVILSTFLFGTGVWAFFSRHAAKTVLPAISALTLADSVIGSYFHIRGVQRKPGGWRLPMTNMVMGPPLFAPLLFGISAYLGIVASFLQADDDFGRIEFPRPAHSRHWAAPLFRHQDRIDWEQDLREGRFQKHMAVATAIAAGASGIEASYSHYKNNFSYKAQWTPVVIAPLLAAAAVSAVKSKGMARTWLPALSSVAILDGAVGFAYHSRGILRRPGGSRMIAYNLLHGPPIFAPLLFAAAGFVGLLASLMRREK